jgi:hypothetical protein
MSVPRPHRCKSVKILVRRGRHHRQLDGERFPDRVLRRNASDSSRTTQASLKQAGCPPLVGGRPRAATAGEARAASSVRRLPRQVRIRPGCRPQPEVNIQPTRRTPPIARLAEQRDGLGPTEDLLDQFPHPLADRIAAVRTYPTVEHRREPHPLRSKSHAQHHEHHERAFRRSGNEAGGREFAFCAARRGPEAPAAG